MNPLDLKFVFPEIILVGFAVILLILGVTTNQKRILGLLAFLGITTAFFFLSKGSPTTTAFSHMLVNDGLSVFFRSISLVIAGLVILLSMGYKNLGDEEKGEYYFFILTITTIMMLASSSNNLLMIYITLEAISLLSYILAGYTKRDMFSSEAGLKYFLFGVLSTGITLYGVSLVYGLFGSLDLNVINQHLTTGNLYAPLVFLAFLLVLTGFGFKCSLVPFHMWTPDVYQGAPTPVAAFFSVGPKAIGFAFLLRVFIITFSSTSTPWVLLLGTIAVLTMTIGNVVAVSQDNIKRLLAYSTIAQAGYILVGLAAGTSGVGAVLFYLFIYAFMNLGAFAVVIAVSNSTNSEMIEDYAGLYKNSPFLAVILAISLLSLAGMPPLAGFLAKFFVFAAAIEKGLIGLVIAAALNSVVALYYYVRIIKFAFLHEPKTSAAFTPPSQALVLSLGLIFSVILIFGLWPQPLLNWLAGLTISN